MAFIPKFRLYDSTGVTLIYTFPVVFETNLPQNTLKTVVLGGIRGIGSLVVNGGVDSWEALIRGVFIDDSYALVTDLIDGIESSVLLNTKYLLRLDKTETTYYEYRVKRINPIEYQNDGNRTNYQEYLVRFLVNSW